MRLIYALSIVSVLGTTSLARADDPVTPKNLPQCTQYKAEGSGERICGYANIEDWKVVLRVDAEVTHLREQLLVAQQLAGEMTTQKAQLQKQLAALQDSQALLRLDRDKLTTDLIALDKKYQDERVKPQWGSPIAWAIAGVSVAVLAGFVINSAIN